ncbi:MAG: 6-phosphofructokinase [Bradymonadia bacterium]
MSHRHIGILTSGGDAPGMNAAIRTATLVALSQGCTVSGIERGYRGLIDGQFRALQPGDVAGIIRDGGTILGSARAPEFAQPEVRVAARRQLHEAGITGLVIIGGNGSLTGALALANADEAQPGAPAPTITGIPASIDNDMGCTQLSIGVDTAMNTIVEACDKLADTASAHHRAFIVEVMGRACGYLAMTSAVATGANAVFFREFEQSEDEVVDTLEKAVVRASQRTDRPKRALAIKAEGVSVPTDRLKARLDERLKARDDESSAMETRYSILGHVVRGGRPSAFDRLLASRMGHVAARSLIDGGNCVMTGWMSEGIPPEAGGRSPYDPHVWQIDLATALKETERLLSGESDHVKWRVKIFRELEDVLAL